MKTLTADHPLVVPEGFKADTSAYDSIVTDFNEELDIVMKKIKYINGDKVKWCARIVQEAVITKGLTTARSKRTDEDYYFFECKEEGSTSRKVMRSLVGTNYIEAIEENGGEPYEIFAKGEEVTNESFYAMVDGKVVARNQGSGVTTRGVTLTDDMTKALEAFVGSSAEADNAEADNAKQPQ
jgi:hypothetical protein